MMKKTHLALFAAAFLLGGCSERNEFLLTCNTLGFNDLRDLTFQECRCVADELEQNLAIEDFSDLNKILKNREQPQINSTSDIVLRDAGRKCVNPLKQ